jgi:hypothetical protein
MIKYQERSTPTKYFGFDHEILTDLCDWQMQHFDQSSLEVTAGTYRNC